MSFRLLGDSVQIKEINETIKQVAPTDVSTLVTGESGTGKEVVAVSIHELSKRKDQPFIAVNCGAIPEGIIESELFGHQKGAFTGAIDDRRGYFELADKGTIFLDEIGDMPLATQVKFLRVLETGEFMRVGGNKNINVDVRVLAATNKDLSGEVLNKNFREDLYYRLNVFPIRIPPLRERRGDLVPLARFFVNRFSKEFNQLVELSPQAEHIVLNYDWPGNVRELENVMQRAVILESTPQIQPSSLQLNIDDTANISQPTGENEANKTNIAEEMEKSIKDSSDSADMKELERRHILDTLASVKGSRKLAIEKLGISERTLRYKLKKYREEGYLD